MLPSSEKNAFVSSWNNQVALLGIAAGHRAAGGPLTNIKCGFVKPKITDVVNAYDEEDRVCTIRKTDLTNAPQKFDVIVLADGSEYAIKEISDIYLNDIHLGWRAICRGD